MRKIANTHELQSELQRLLRLAGSHQPSRVILASELSNLSLRVAAEASWYDTLGDLIADIDFDMDHAARVRGERENGNVAKALKLLNQARALLKTSVHTASDGGDAGRAKIVTKARQSLQKIVNKYAKYSGPDDAVGGMFYGNVPIQQFRQGGLEVIEDTYVGTRQVIVGVKIGANWFPFPAEAKSDAELREKYYTERARLRKNLKQEIEKVLLPLREKLSEPPLKAVWDSAEGTSWSAYFLAMIT